MIPDHITHFKVQFFSMLVQLFLPVLEEHLKLSFWKHQQLLHCNVLNCSHIINYFSLYGIFKFREKKKSPEAISGE
jgi:hypothetical protein